MKFQFLKFIICLFLFGSVLGWGQLYTKGDTYTDVIVQKTEGNVKFINKSLNLKTPLCFVTGRLYLPMKELITSIGGKVSETEDKYILSWSSFQYEISKEEDEMLVQPLYIDHDVAYISVYDLGELFHLAVVFDSNNKTVEFYNRIMPETPDEKKTENLKKAYLRFEDVSAQQDGKDDSLEKMRVMFDYLYSEGQNYYIAWIPVYLNPPLGIHNDLTKDFNFYNADFIYTLDYAVNHFGHIVLHGYTHQELDSVSGVGTEFGGSTPLSRSEIDARMKQAKETARILGYDDSIFEFPHNAATLDQLRIAENNFDVIYQQGYYSKRSMGKIDTVRRFNHKVQYVPTPAGYLPAYADLPDLLNRIDKIPSDQLVGMFVHPYLELPQIKCETTGNGERVFRYDDNGIYKQLVKKITEKGMVFSPISIE